MDVLAQHGETVRIYRYEDVIFKKREWLADMCAWFGWNVSEKKINAIADKNDILPKAENEAQHIRQATPGDHKRKLRPETIEQLSGAIWQGARLFWVQLFRKPNSGLTVKRRKSRSGANFWLLKAPIFCGSCQPIPPTCGKRFITVLLHGGVSSMKIRTLLLVVVGVGFATPAYAYLDPGTGSILLQGILGSIAAASVAVGAFWTRIKLFFHRARPSAHDTAKTSKS